MPSGFEKYTLSPAELKLDQLPILKVSLPQWSRIEPRPRGEDLMAALSAEVRDGLWMLSRQWQMGEFEGDDCGTPVFSDLDYECSSMGNKIPLNPVVQAVSVFNEPDVIAKSFDIRLQMANMWLRMVSERSELASVRNQFIQNRMYALPPADAAQFDEDTHRLLDFYRGKSFDGYLFYQDAKRFDTFPAALKVLLEICFKAFESWYKRTYFQPDDNDNWNKANLEYNYGMEVIENEKDNAATVMVKSLVMDEFYERSPEWYHLKVQSQSAKTATPEIRQVIKNFNYGADVPGRKKLMPAPVRFGGMPESRFWAFEDGGTNLAAVGAGVLDLGRIALVEFGLIYSNDWSLVPIKVPVGSLTSIRSLKIVDSFGKTTLLQPVDQGNPNSWNLWSFFSLDKIKADNAGKSDNSIATLPTISKTLSGETLEEVVFVTDEMANLVWAVETTILSPSGKGVEGRILRSPAKREKGTRLFYEAQSTVPANWIPFAPVVPDPANPNRIVYRRGKMLDENGQKIFPNTSLIRHGLTRTNQVNRVYDIEHHEIVREGISLQLKYQYGRWVNGEVFLWKGIQKDFGSGEGSSGLAFDSVTYRE